jgi:GT2 family glycosyltransferase
MKICAVTVTYGNRAEFCIKISENIIAQGIHQLIIIDNGSVVESRDKLIQFANKNPSVKLITLATNTGSAFGFGAGISAFLGSASDFILLLDDDNLPGTDMISGMVRFWEENSEIEKEKNLALSAFRKDRPNMIAAMQSGNPKYILPVENSFMGFHIRLMGRFIRQRVKMDRTQAEGMRPFLEIPVSPYGGLWMHRRLCERIGLPDIEYVLYMDDFAYTKRITDLNGKIILLRDCSIQDIQESYYLPVKKTWLYHSLLYASNDSITYYTCRNIVFFCKGYLVTNLFVYGLNRFLYFMAVFMLSIISHKIRKLRIIYLAVRDAESPSMGLKLRFPLT